MVRAVATPAAKEGDTRARGSARGALLDAAHKLVRRKGWHATTVDDLCAEAGVTKGAFFHHFATKEDLGLAAAQHWTAVTAPLFANAPYQRLRDPLQRIFGYLDFRATLAEGPLEAFTCFAGTAVQEVFATSEPMRVALGATITGHAAQLARDFAAAIERHPPRIKVSAEGLALYTQTVLQGGFVLAKSTGDQAALLDAIAHLKNYLRLLFKEKL
jgi:TetR/AcrR family transcriptional repressor of nem operon